MAVPAHKLPALLQNPVIFQKFSKISFIYAPKNFAKNNVRWFYKNNAPLLKYYNPHMKLEIQLQEKAEPVLQVFGINGQKIGEIPNTKKSEEFLATLTKIHEGIN
ncbi:unnamed protein product [Blepharisma stoltei]|uniref:Ribosomal protein/NADH dehydrogenase domain-containing protein n=1 Tax=Blepharisma stoltei TaxID=1481888 RepID=A0AAU9IKW3_9CILI|nr:unnamed protein product [Blepharisma stoltei]